VVGGLASGLASYFAVDETVVRLLFVLGIFVFGQGLIIYLVLWAITPEARTLTDKMQMQGEPVTLSNIESNIKKSLHVGENERESTLVKILLFPFRILAALFSGLSQALGPMLRFSLEALRVLVGLFLVMLSLITTVCLLVALGVCLGWSTNEYGLVHLGDIPVEMVRRSFPTGGFIFAFIAVFIPFLSVGLLGLMMIVRRRLFSAALGWTVFSVWVIGLIGLGVTVPAFANSFRSSYSVEKVQTFDIGNKTLLLKLRDAGEEEYQETRLTLEGYAGNGLRLVQHFKARGRNREQAGIHAEMITYQVTQADSVLTFDANFSFRENALFRAQELEMTLQIPYGKNFVMDEDIRDILRNTLYVNGYDDDQIKGNVWKFTKDSSLVCLTCKEGARRIRSQEGAYDEDNEDRSYAADLNFDEEEGGDDDGYKKRFQLRNFDRLDLGSAFEIRVRQGDAFKVEAGGNRKDVENLDAEVNGSTLNMEYGDNSGFRFGRHRRVKIYITMPRLRAVDFSGASQSVIQGFDATDPVSIHISGASQSKIRMRAAKLDLEVSGASQVNVEGQSEKLEARVTGASTLDAFELAARQVEVDASGASTAQVSADVSLRAEATGASHIRYRGNPKNLNEETSGAGSVSRE
jgi:phage shock protein PspC (stress-responsive transcriptional regulator)